MAVAYVTDLNQNSNGAVPIIIDIFSLFRFNNYFLLIIIIIYIYNVLFILFSFVY